MDAYVGIDLAFAKNKRLPVVVCVHKNGRLEPLSLRDEQASLPPIGAGNPKILELESVDTFAKDTARYLHDIEPIYGIKICRIAIDAPSNPKKAGSRRREAEQALDMRGISCITTPSDEEFDIIRQKATAHLAAGGAPSRMPHANQLWMLVGFALFHTLRITWECIEVFPQATVKVLGAATVHKRRPNAVLSQLTAAAQYTLWPIPPRVEALAKIGYGALHDRLDAYLAAWVASLDSEDREPIGTPPDDVIWIPKTSSFTQAT